jgi:hypothetical protein
MGFAFSSVHQNGNMLGWTGAVTDFPVKTTRLRKRRSLPNNTFDIGLVMADRSRFSLRGLLCGSDVHEPAIVYGVVYYRLHGESFTSLPACRALEELQVGIRMRPWMASLPF